MAKTRPQPLIMMIVGAVFFLLGTAGCAGRDLYPVRGKVVYQQGQPISPLVGGLVMFEPLDPKAKASARGEIQPDGSFLLGTFQEGDGAAPGEYRVLVIPPTPPSQAKEIRPPSALHPRFHNLEKTPLKLTVQPQANDFTLIVEKP